MKYTIEGFSQREAVELGLDTSDLCILRWIVDFYNTDKMTKMQIENKVYFWVRYESIIEDLPILGLKTKDALYRRLKKLVMCSVLEHTTVKQGGVFSMYRFGENYVRLVSDEKLYRSDEKSEGFGWKVGRGTDEKSEQNINLLNNPSTKDKEKVEQSSTIPISDIITYLNTKADTKFKSSSADTKKLITARWDDGYRLEDFFSVIDVKVRDWKGDDKMSQYLRPRTLFGTKFESYLQQSSKSHKKAPQYNPDNLAKNQDGTLVAF